MSSQCQSNIWLPAQRFHEIFVQEVMISFHRSYVNGELGIWKKKKKKKPTKMRQVSKWHVIFQTELMDGRNWKERSGNHILSRSTMNAGRPSNLFCMWCWWEETEFAQITALGLVQALRLALGMGLLLHNSRDWIQTLWIEHSTTFMRSR